MKKYLHLLIILVFVVNVSNSFSQPIWKNLCDLNLPRCSFGAVKIGNNQILVFGGLTSNHVVTNTCEIIDIANKTSTLTNPMKIGRAEFAYIVTKDTNIIVLGGSQDFDNLKCTRSVERYNKQTGEWELIGSLQIPRMQAAALQISNNEIIIAGSRTTGFATSLKDVEIFNIKNGTSKLVNEFPYYFANGRAAISSQGDLLFFAWRDGQANSKHYAQVYRYNVSKDAWELVTYLPQELQFPDVLKLKDSRLLVSGGCIWEIPMNYSDDILIENNNNFTSIAKLPVGLQTHQMNYFNDSTILITGGFNSNYLPVKECNFLNLNTYTISSGPAFNYARGGHKLLTVENNCNNTLIAIGGADNVDYGSIASVEILETEAPEVPKIKLYQDNIEIIDTVDIGKICIKDKKSILVALKNVSEVNLIYTENEWTENEFFDVEILSGKSEIIPQDTSTVQIIFSPTEEKVYYSELTVKFSSCDSYTKKYIIKGEGVNSDLEFIGTGVFSDTRVGNATQTTITLKNKGSQSAYIQNTPLLPSPFSIVSIVPPIPTELAPEEQIVFTLQFAPVAEGQQSATFTAVSVFQQATCTDTANILLTCIATQSRISMSANMMDFGLIASCQTKDDSIKIRNSGNSAAYITNAYIMGGVSSNFTIIKKPTPFPFILSKNSEQTYIIRFNPNNSASGTKTDTLVIQTDDPDASMIKIALVARNESLNVNYPLTVNLGAYPIGKSKSVEVVLTNHGELDVNIRGVYIYPSSPIISITPLKANIKGNNGTAVFTVTLNYNKTGSLSADFEFIYDIPCPAKQLVHVIGEGLEAKFDITETLNFGILAPCEEKTDSIKIVNTGLIPFEITKEPVTEGTDQALFIIENTETFPLTLNPGDIFYVKVKFTPLSSTDGLKQADLVVNFQFSNTNADVRVGLSGERQTGLLSAPNPVEFGSILVGDSRQRTIVLKNVGIIPLTIEKILPNTFFDVFKVVPPDLSVTLQPKDSVEITIKFLPTVVGKYLDTIPLKIKFKTCESLESIVVTGEAMPADVVTLKIDSIFTTPDKRNYRIPIYALIKDKSKTIEMDSFTGTLNFDATMFYPEGLTKGTILENSTVQNSTTKKYVRTFKIKVDNIVISSKDTVLTEIIGATMLGNSDTTSFIWNSANNEWQPGLKIGTTFFKNGFLSFLICKEGNNRLIKQTSGTGLSLKIAPNPGTDEINLSVNVGETGHHIINLITTQGKSFTLFEWKADSVDEPIDFKLNLKNYSNGLYYITITSPTEKQTLPLMVVK